MIRAPSASPPAETTSCPPLLTTVALATWAAKFYADVTPDAAELAQHVTDAVKPALQALAARLATCTWDKASIAAARSSSAVPTDLNTVRSVALPRPAALPRDRLASVPRTLAALARRADIYTSKLSARSTRDARSAASSTFSASRTDSTT